MTTQTDRPLLLTIGASTRQIVEAINQLMNGKSVNTGTVTLTASTTSTVVTDRRVGVNSVISFMPITSNGAVSLNDTTNPLYVSSRGDGTFTITHRSDAAVDQDLEYTVTG